MKRAVFVTLLLAFTCKLVAGTFAPTAPGPNYTVNAGSPCVIQWDSDPSWSNTSITLMSGDNFAMKSVTTVATGLGSNASSLNWTAPEVTPYSAIYFFQFTNGDDTADSTWTTRFTIASPSGQSTDPANPTQPNGAAIPWGVGTLASASISSSTAMTSATTTATTTLSNPSSSSSATRMHKVHKPSSTITRQATPTLSVPQSTAASATTTAAYRPVATQAGNSAKFVKMQAFGAWTGLAWVLVQVACAVHQEVL